MAKLSLKDLDLQDKTVIMRVDFNVPLDDTGNVTDDTRIRSALPSIKYILDKGSKLILMSHLGRPKGKRVDAMSLAPAAKVLGKLLDKDVKMAPDCIGEEVEKMAKELKPGEVMLLENLRFHAEEKDNDPGFAKKLAGLADVYVDDAFGTAHRAHASTVGITQYLKSAAGFLIDKEIEYLGMLLENPARPFVAILGGAKVSDKIPVIQNLIKRVNSILIGGAMSYTFLKTKDKSIGKSLVEDDKLEIALELLSEANNSGVELMLPVDHVVADKFDAPGIIEKVGSEIPEDLIGLDIGPKTIEKYCQKIATAKTVFWNGPMGKFEDEQFATGTYEIAKALAASEATSVIGGGDSVAAINKFNLQDKISHISTGGGASLEFIQGKELPGIAALTDK